LQELSKAEILVMDLTRGIPVGFCSLSLLERGNELQEDSQDSLLEYGKKQKTTVDTPSWSSSSSLELKSELLYHPPTEKQEQDSSNNESARGDKAIGNLYTSYNFSSITGDEISKHVEGCSENSSDQDGGDQEPGGAIEVAISKQGPWFPVVVNYGLGPAAWHLGKDIFLASEMMVEEMIKHLFVRTMVTVENASDFVLEVRLCLDFLLDKTEEEIKGAAVEQQEEEDGQRPARESCLYLSDVGPNSSISCPLKSLCPGSLEYCLQVKHKSEGSLDDITVSKP
jgi:vacuolar protein sorting-associated protein 13A/C